LYYLNVDDFGSNKNFFGKGFERMDEQMINGDERSPCPSGPLNFLLLWLWVRIRLEIRERV